MRRRAVFEQRQQLEAERVGLEGQIGRDVRWSLRLAAWLGSRRGGGGPGDLDLRASHDPWRAVLEASADPPGPSTWPGGESTCAPPAPPTARAPTARARRATPTRSN